MSHNLNSSKGRYIRDFIGTTIGVIKGDARTLEYSIWLMGFLHLRKFPYDLGFNVQGCIGF